MKVCTCAEPAVAIFRNVGDLGGKNEGTALLLSAADLEIRRQTVRQLSDRCSKISAKSLPSPPSGGAS
jgi:hypothetical protein